MTMINLPSVQPAAKPAAGKQPQTGNGSEDNDSFQDVLAGQVNKTNQADKAKSDAAEPARDSRAGKTNAKADSQPADEQAQAQDDTRNATGKDMTAEQALPLLAGLADAGAALAGKAAVRAEGADAAVSPRRADTAQPAVLTAPEAGLGERGSKDALPAVGASAARKTAPVRHEDPRAIEAPAHGRQASTPAPVTGDKAAAAHEAVPVPDFAKLLAAREAPAPAVPPAAMQAAAVHASVADPVHVIEPRLGSRDWGQAVSQKVVWMVGATEQSATLTLNPPDLGPLQVVIQVNNDQADAAFMSDNPDVRQALQDSLGTLRSMMSSAGIQLGDASISAGSRGQEQMQQQFQQSQRQAAADNRQADSMHSMRLETPVARHGSGSGLVDTFA